MIKDFFFKHLTAVLVGLLIVLLAFTVADCYYSDYYRYRTETVQIGGHEGVDLGLSVVWATCNVDGTCKEDPGKYYAWGETESKKHYTWETYKWGDGLVFNKYCKSDSLTQLLLEDDVVQRKWGKG